MSHTPTTEAGLRRLDSLPAAEAVLVAWTAPGPRPDWHFKMQAEVRDSMPVLARALDRLAREGR
jgi:hypothetical protein